jgi:hypothetical protein
MQNELIELSDVDTDTDSKIVCPVEEPTELSRHTGTSKVATLKAKLAAQRKLVAELGKEYNKLRKENKQLKNEQDIHAAKMTGFSDRLDNALRQLSQIIDIMVRVWQATCSNTYIMSSKGQAEELEVGCCMRSFFFTLVPMLTIAGSHMELPSRLRGIRVLTKTCLTASHPTFLYPKMAVQM